MAIITCAECGGKVSDKADTCPHCGAPVSRAKETAAAGQTITTVQQTSKKLKMHTLISLSIGIIGFLMVIGTASAEQEPSALGSLMALVGFVWFIVTRFRIWWHHS